ncbi:MULTISPECIES: hypothetical protein [unclassified Synechococcus]|uniref:hypothetical protein n=1 Tax=unclassified Synechococcus TaxID=2626047 RepID=UPI0008FF3257|nr:MULTISPECIES: hypothetical protein [unclassified Synechococcus]APD47620.1 hypothetical protein BM449_04230 [Synechococcus sp. SynAce01]MCT0245452.1 hypothetical protein [Synechococcus sp. CS-601]
MKVIFQAVEDESSRAKLLLLLPGLLALIACGGTPPPSSPSPEAQAPAADPATALLAPKSAAQTERSATTIGKAFTPLPTGQQVLAASAERRSDPFAPLPDARGPQPVATSGSAPVASSAKANPTPSSKATPVALPPGFQFNGVISVAGVKQALVAFGNESGSVSIGDQGGSQTPMLPPGWSVASIDAGNGSLQLRSGKQLVTTWLSPALP